MQKKNKRLPMRVKISTPRGAEGFGMSYSEEERAVLALLDILPKEYRVEITWCQILDADVKWEIDHETKEVFIAYNQNLRHWQPLLVKAIYLNLVKKYGEPKAKTRKRSTSRDIRVSR